jgi:hypothetical protein
MTIDKKVELLEKLVREHNHALRYFLCDPRASDERLREYLINANGLIYELDADEADGDR